MRYLAILLSLLFATPVWAGASRNFDGTNDTVTVTNGASGPFDVGGDLFTLSFWIKTSAANDVIMGSNVDPASLSSDHTMVKITSVGTVQFRYGSGDSDSFANAVSTTVITDGVWYHITAVRSGTKTAKIYINGVEEDSDTYAGSLTGVNQTEDFIIGEDKNGSNDLAADVAYVSWYGARALSVDEINESIHKTFSIVNGLEMALPLWGSDSPEIDLTGNGNTGTVSGATESSDGPPVMIGAGPQ